MSFAVVALHAWPIAIYSVGTRCLLGGAFTHGIGGGRFDAVVINALIIDVALVLAILVVTVRFVRAIALFGAGLVIWCYAGKFRMRCEECDAVRLGGGDACGVARVAGEVCEVAVAIFLLFGQLADGRAEPGR